MDRPVKKGLGALADLALTFHQTQSQQGEIEKQTKILTDPAIDQKTRNAALFDRGYAYLLAEKDDLAVADFTTLIETGQETEEEHAETLYNRARAYWNLQDLPREREDLLAITQLADAPADLKSRAHIQLGYSFGELKEPEQEAFHYNAAYEVDGAPADVRYDAKIRLARAFNTQARYEQTEQLLSWLLSQEDVPHAQRIEALHSYSVALDHMDRPEDAILNYTTIIRMPEANNFDRSEAYYWRGHLLDYIERHEEAVRDFSAVLRMEGLDPWTTARALFARGCVNGKRERADEELADFTRLIELRYEPLDPRVEHYRIRAYARRGYALKQLERPEEAIADFNIVLADKNLTPYQTADALIDRGSALAMAERYSQAIDDFNAVLALADLPAESASSLVSDALWYKSLVLADLNQLNESIEVQTELLALPDISIALRLRTLNRRGYHYYRTGQPSEAQADFQFVFEHAEASAWQRSYALTFFAEICIDQGNAPLAIEHLKQAAQVEEVPTNQRARICWFEGQALALEQQHHAAIDSFTRGLAYEDVTPYMQHSLREDRAASYLALRQEQQAIADYDAAVAIDGLDGETIAGTYYSCGNAYYTLKQYETAQQHYAKVLASDEVSPELEILALYAHALCHDRTKNYAEAVEEYRQLVQRDDVVGEQEADFLYALANTHSKAKQYAQSEAIYQAVIDHEATDPVLKAKAIINSGVDFELQFRFDEALARFTEVLQHNAGPEGWRARAHCNRASCYYHLGQFELVVQETELALAEEQIEDNDYAESFFFYGTALAYLGRFDEALAQHEKTLDLEYDDVDEQAEVYLFRGITYKRMQKWDEALADFRQGIAIAKENSFQHAVGLRHLGEVLLRQGMPVEAAKALYAALALEKLSPRDTEEAQALLREIA
ncbi:tetratricopeptide repeat protein [Blastopirellula marina]|uniref:Uncharacterized protein n=1 Tax=Blastopirellula marina TaxID=124 RepID=A0A2S8GDQ9_9BACT|nr:tetratricopeptide repeat protein [Blastopirellula marina]PQO42597.1 hypothetical protein C5Y98_01805 [Blastopirellula marina]PTL46363.1 tetratricopeptide repeat protein [Blastopirellula marina]